MTDPDSYAPGVFLAGSLIPNADADHPPQEQAISWVRQSDGSLAAEIYSFEFAAGAVEALYSRAFARAGGSAESMNLASVIDNESIESYVSAQANAISGGGRVYASSNNHVVNVINSDTSSSFVQGNNLAAANLAVNLNGSFYSPWAPFLFNVQNKCQRAVLIGQCSCYSTTVGTVYSRMFMDGVLIGYNSFFFNNTFEHHTIPFMTGLITNLAAGNHNIQMDVQPLSGGTPAIDVTNDVGSFVLIG